MEEIKNIKEWHNVVCRRAGYICAACGRDFSDDYYFIEDGGMRRNAYLCGHHFHTQGSHPELKLDPKNGICVCLQCHNLIHNGTIQVSDLSIPSFN